MSVPAIATNDYWIARAVLQHGIAALYVIAFLSGFAQFPALLGERGLLPVPRYLRLVSWRRAPSLFHWRYSDRLLRAVTLSGAAIGILLVVGLPQLGPPWAPMLAFLLMWALYLSIVNVGQIFYAFGWESLLLEAGFFAAFLGSDAVAPPAPVVYLLRWLVFRVEFGAGMIKMRGDPCWRDFTCLYYHHETQPMPGPLSWYFHRLPKPLHRVEVAANHIAQLIVPFGLFAPQPVASVCACVVVVTQLWLVASGNFSWLNWLTILLAFSAIDDRFLGVTHASVDSGPPWWVGVVLAFSAGMVVLSYWPAKNLLSRRQLMNAPFNPFHLVNAYGAFGSITRYRDEIVIEGTDAVRLDESTSWREYEFKGKPGPLHRRPPQVAPYHLRLDWLMWFAAMSSPQRHPWFVALVVRLLQADPATLRLLRRDPFDGKPPRYVRALLYRYRFTTWRERRRSGEWWKRELVGLYLPPLALADTPLASRR
ncbi:MAG: lipase maturation factor family protein [Acidothermus sp.]|nr:lipase maturation factor family protein [Acidothermus sp.]